MTSKKKHRHPIGYLAKSHFFCQYFSRSPVCNNRRLQRGRGQSASNETTNIAQILFIVRVEFPRGKAAKLIQHILFVARGGYDAKPGRQPVDARGKEVHNRLALRPVEGFVEGINEQVAPSQHRLTELMKRG